MVVRGILVGILVEVLVEVLVEIPVETLMEALAGILDADSDARVRWLKEAFEGAVSRLLCE